MTVLASESNLEMTSQIIANPEAISETDQALVEAAKCSPEKFAPLYDRHCTAIANYLYRRTHDSHVTEDLLSEVFLSALRDLPRYQPRGVPFRAWLYRIAGNALRKWVRSNAREQRRLQKIADHGATTPSCQNQMPLDDTALLRLIHSLSAKHQEVISLHYFERLSLKQITDILGILEGTVKSRLGRARSLLRDRIQQAHSQQFGED